MAVLLLASPFAIRLGPANAAAVARTPPGDNAVGAAVEAAAPRTGRVGVYASSREGEVVSAGDCLVGVVLAAVGSSGGGDLRDSSITCLRRNWRAEGGCVDGGAAAGVERGGDFGDSPAR